MKKIGMAALMFSTLWRAAAALSIQNAEIIRPALAKKSEEAIVLSGEPEKAKVLAPPPVLLYVDGWPEDDQPAALEMRAATESAAELELQGILPNGTPIVFDRRTITKGDGGEIVRWQIEPEDRVTSFTLAARMEKNDGMISIHSAAAKNIRDMPLSDRLTAYAETPLWITSAAKPIRGGVLSLEMTAPADLREELKAATLFIEISNTGTLASKQVRLNFDRDGIAPIEVEMENLNPDSFTATVYIEEARERTELARIDAVHPAMGTPYFEVPSRSVESLSVIERNGELAVYTIVAERGHSHGSIDVPLFGEEIRLSVGNGKEWVVDEELMRSRRDSDWLGGGPLEFSVGTLNDDYYGYFTVAFPSGPEALGVAYGRTSLRIVPSAKNPVWMPKVESAETAAIWRGNGFLVFNNSTMLAGLEKYPGEEPHVRLLSSPNQIEWTDLGILDLPNFDAGNQTIATFQREGAWYILATPGRQLYAAQETPLRNWMKSSIEMPEDWRKPAIIQWANQLWMFAIKECNGRGVVVWAPILHDEGVFRILSEYEFKPAPLNDKIPAPAERGPK